MNYPEPSVQFKCLHGHFFRRFFDFEAIASSQIDAIEKNALTFQIFGLMVSPGMLECWFLFQKYRLYTYRPIVERDLATLTDKCFFLSLSMILLGIIVAFEWDMLFPDRTDYLILTPMPVKTRMIFWAKTTALVSFLLAFTVAIDLGPAFLFPGAVLANNSFAHRVLGKTAPISTCLRYSFSHAASMLAANIFIFFSAISVQGLLLNLMPGRIAQSVSRWVRFLCLLLFLGAFLSFPQIVHVDQIIHDGNRMLAYYPPLWFVGLYETMLGSREAIMLRLAGRAIGAMAIAGALAAISYALCYRRFMRRSIESSGTVLHRSAGIRRIVNAMLNRWVLRKPESRASYHFVGQTVFRSSRHVLYMGTYMAVGLAIAGLRLTTLASSQVTSIGQYFDRTVLSIPLILTFFLLVGMRVVFSIPVDLEANWLFQVAPLQRLGGAYAGVRKFLVGVIVIPLYLLAGIFYGLFWSWDAAALHVCYGLTMSLLLMELLFVKFPKIPFTCSYLPGAARLVLLYPFYFFGFSIFGYSAASFEIWLAAAPHRFLYFYGMAAVALCLMAYRSVQFTGEKICFEEQSAVAPTYLDLRS
jgi:hypothetical protein